MAMVSGPPEYGIHYIGLYGDDVMLGIAGNSRHAEITLSLALTTSDNPGIAYVDDRSGDLVYAERTPQGWITETIDAAGQVGYFPALAFDEQNTPHISYFDNSLNDIKYATRKDESWRIETVDAEGQPGFHIPSGFTQLGLHCEPDIHNCTRERPQIAYLAYRYKPYDGELRFATREEWGWKIETIDSTQGAGGFPDLLLDPEGYPWISYYRARTWDYHSGELRVAHYTGYEWQIEKVDRHNNAGRFSALAWSPANHPVVAYYAARTGDLHLAWKSDAWHTQLLISDNDKGGWVQLAIGESDLAYLAYVDTAVQSTQYVILKIPD